MFSTNRTSPALKHSLLWLAASLACSPLAAVAALVGTEIGYRFQSVLDVNPFPLSLQLIVGLTCFGGILGAAQSLVLRQLVGSARQWILLSMLAFPMGFQLAWLVSPRRCLLETPLALILLAAIQSLFFWRHAKRAYLWVTFHAASGFLALLLPNVGADTSINLVEALLGALLTGAMFAVPGAAAIPLMFQDDQLHGAA
jgi:hypothetical protein